MKKSAVVFGVVGALGVYMGCQPGEGYLTQQYLVTCENSDLDETREYCIRISKHCAIPTDRDVCAWNWYEDTSLEKTDHFLEPDGSASVVKANCWGAGFNQGELPPSLSQPECGANGGSASGGEDTTSASGQPTSTSGEPTSGGSSGDTGGGDETYICALNFAKKCANLKPDNALGTDIYYNDLNDPQSPLLDDCWGAVNTDSVVPIYSKCALAPDESTAKTICQKDCHDRMAAIEESMKNACGWTQENGWPEDCQIITPIDCDINLKDLDNVDDMDDKVALLSAHSNYACDGDPLTEESVSDSALFLGLASAVTPDGYNAGASNVMGTIGFSLSNCNPNSCDIVVGDLRGHTTVIQGGFSDAAGSGGSFFLQGVGFQSVNTVSGIWDKQQGTVVFPTGSLQLRFWSGPGVVDGLSVPGEPGALVSIDQLVGSLRTESGPLTLNLSYRDTFGLASFSLETLTN